MLFLCWRSFRASNPAVRPIAEQWHEAALPPKYSRRCGWAHICSFFCVGALSERRTRRFAPLRSNGTRADNSPKKRCRPFARSIPGKSVEPGGSPHCGAMARGGVAAEVFPALGVRLCMLIFLYVAPLPGGRWTRRFARCRKRRARRRCIATYDIFLKIG